MRHIYIISILLLFGLSSYCQDLLNSYSTGSNAIVPARIKYFGNHVYIVANITVGNQTFPCLIKLDDNGNIIWQTRLDQAGVGSDLEFVPQSSSSDKSILLVGSSATSLNNLDNKSFIWKVKDDGTHLICKFYEHTGNEDFVRIILHPNPINSNFKYYIVGKRNVAFPVTTQNPAHSYKTILYNIDENLNVNWSQNFEIISGVSAGREAQFFNSIVPETNGNINLLGSEKNLTSQIIVSGTRMIINPSISNGIGYKSSSPREYRDGVISSGQLQIASHLFNFQGQFLGSDISRGNGGSLGVGQKYISNLSGHNGIIGIGNDLFTTNVKIGNPNGGKTIINKYQISTNPTYTLNYINSVVINPPAVTTNFGFQQINVDASGNIIFSTSSNNILYFGKINNTLISSTASSCYIGTAFTPINDNDDGNEYQWKFNSEPNSSNTVGQSISFNLTQTTICAPSCTFPVDFSFTQSNCKTASFTPIVTGGTGPYTYSWDFDCTGPAESSAQNPTYNFTNFGTQCVKLKITDATGQCMGMITKNITLVNSMTVDFNFTQSNCKTASFAPIVTGSAGALNYSWDFDCNAPPLVQSTLQNPTYSFPNLGDHCVKLTVTDAAGCTALITKNITLIDVVDPLLNCIPAVSIQTNPSSCTGAFATGIPTDDCDPNPTLFCTYSGASNGTVTGGGAVLNLDLGVTSIECVATDASGNSSLPCNTVITVTDNTPPTITCPTNIEVNADPCIGSIAVNFPNPQASDNCPGVTYNCSHQSGSNFLCGTTTVSCTAIDASGNASTPCTFNIDVNCDCISNSVATVICNPNTGLHDFEINFTSNLGQNCNVTATIDPAVGTILNQNNIWTGSNGQITGSIDPVNIGQSLYTFNLTAVCICIGQNQVTCNTTTTAPVNLCLASFDKVYGDTTNNIATGIKVFGGGIYVTSKRDTAIRFQAVISKFNLSTGMLVWEKKLNKFSEISDFEYDDKTDALILVGNTYVGNIQLPGQSLQDFSSFILKIDCISGSILLYNQYAHSGRENFERIIKHNNPANNSFPYYVLGHKNPGLPSTLDRVLLYEMDNNLNLNLKADYFSNTNGVSTDDEYSRGIISLTNGQIVVTGNETTVNKGLLIRVNPANNLNAMAISQAFPATGNDQYDVYDGLQINNNQVLIVGEQFNTHQAFISVLSGNIINGLPLQTFQHTKTVILDSIIRFRDVYEDDHGNYYAIGQCKKPGTQYDSSSVVCKFRFHANQIDIIYLKRLNEGNETEFTEGKIFVSKEHDKIFYVDSRKNLAASSQSSLGKFDMVVGVYDLNFDTKCVDTIRGFKRITYDLQQYPVATTTAIPPVPSTSLIVNNSPLLCEEFCGVDCNLSVNIDVMNSNCIDYTFTAVIQGGTGPYNILWDRDCMVPYESSNQSYSYTFSGPGTYCIALYVTDVNGCSASHQVQVTISDIIKPTLICPQNITLNTDLNHCYATYGGLAATDDCDLNPIIHCTLIGATNGTFSGMSNMTMQYNKGTTTVTCYAQDVAGNISMPPCVFTVTVIDNQQPTIICPQPPSITVEYCDGGGIANFQDPTISDNCPMVSFTCNHASGDFYPCGVTPVQCIVTDMSENTNSCSFNVNVNCTCAEISSSEIVCGQVEDTYDFTITVENLSGNGATCNLILSMNALDGVFASSPNITWFNEEATITGTINPIVPITSNFEITIQATCVCPDQTPTTCTLPLTLVPPCCKSIIINDEEACKSGGPIDVSFSFTGSDIDITNVSWYFCESDVCPPPSTAQWHLYATTSDMDVSFDPSGLPPSFCVYAVMNSTDFVCKQLTSNTVHIKICDVPKCTLSTQEFCYNGSSIIPAPIVFSTNEHCDFNINWYDQNGNLAPGSQNSTSFQPNALNWSSPLTDCKQEFVFKAEIENLCGVSNCESVITLHNGLLTPSPINIYLGESTPICPGEDLRLLFSPICPQAPPIVTWTWLEGSTSNNMIPIGGSGSINPIYNTNMMFEDTWYGVAVQNGVCPPDTSKIFIDVLGQLALSFSAEPAGPCRDEGVLLEASFELNGCPGILTWYKDGVVIQTSTVTGNFESFIYTNPALGGSYSGNYYVILESTCCDKSLNSDVVNIEPPILLNVSAPCFRCDDDVVTLEAMLANDDGSCTFNWFKSEPGVGYVEIIGQNSSTLQLNEAGQFLCVATCGLCSVEKDVSFIQCLSGPPCSVGTSDISYLSDFLLYPNPTTGQLMISFDDPIGSNLKVSVLDVLGRLIQSQVLKKGMNDYELNLSEKPEGVYMIRLGDESGGNVQRKVIKIE